MSNIAIKEFKDELNEASKFIEDARAILNSDKPLTSNELIHLGHMCFDTYNIRFVTYAQIFYDLATTP